MCIFSKAYKQNIPNKIKIEIQETIKIGWRVPTETPQYLKALIFCSRCVT